MSRCVFLRRPENATQTARPVASGRLARRNTAVAVTWFPGSSILLVLMACSAWTTAGPAAAPAASESGDSVRVAAASSPAAPAAEERRELIPTKSLLEIMDKGGILMWPIALCSIVTVAFFLERLIALRWGRVIPRPFVRRVLDQIRDNQLDRTQALALCEENRSPVAQIFAGAVRKWGRPAVEVEQAIIDAGERVTAELRRYFRVFSGVHTVAPLLGLLGTVFGMIRAFNMVAVSDALGRPELLAAGISEALLTTAAGLTVAIPALIIYVVLLGRVDRLILHLDSLGQELVNMISAEALESHPVESRAPRPRRTTRHDPATTSTQSEAK